MPPNLTIGLDRRRDFAWFRMELPAEWLVLLVSVYFVLFCNHLFFRAILAGHSPRSASTWGLGFSTFALLWSAHVLLLTPFSSRYLLKPVLTILFFGNSVAIYFMTRFHVILNESMIRNVLETDRHEVSELLNARMFLSILAFGVVPAAALWTIRLRPQSRKKALLSRAALAMTAFAILVAVSLVSFKTYASFLRARPEARYLIVPENYLASSVQAAIHSMEGHAGPRIAIGSDAAMGADWRRSNRPAFFVMVVGETARAANFSLNGYSRETNPELKRHHVLNFSQVYSCGTSTAESLPCMFSSGRSGHSKGKKRRYESLLDVLTHAGVPVLWRGNNSGCKGVCDGVPTQHLEREMVPGLCTDGECFDEILLKDFEKLVGSGGNLFLVLHQKGSHGPAYYRRYPGAFERFKPACNSPDFSRCTPEEIRNAYDNSILYTDDFLGKLLDRLSSIQTHDTAMLYVSDHGESLGEHGFYLHGLPHSIAPDTQTHVPMVLWMSPGFVTRFGIDVAAVESKSGQSLSHDNIFHSVLGVLDIRTSEYKRRLDLFAGP